MAFNPEGAQFLSQMLFNLFNNRQQQKMYLQKMSSQAAAQEADKLHRYQMDDLKMAIMLQKLQKGAAGGGTKKAGGGAAPKANILDMFS